MEKIFLIPILQLACTALYSFCDIECRVEELERQVQQLRVVTPNETCGANTALARPILDVECGCCGSNFFVEALVLYWHPKVAGTEFVGGIFSVKEIEPTNTTITTGSTKDCLQFVDFRWNWGFKVGLGYNLPCDGWDIFLNYTGFNSKGHKSVCIGKDNEYLINYKSFPIHTTFTNFVEEVKTTSMLSKKAKSKFCVDLDALELDLGRSFYISKSVVLYPKIGLKAFWIEFKQNTRYTSVQGTFFLFDPPRDQFVLNYTIKDTNKFSGVGPHFIFGTQWHFCNNLYVYGNISGSLLYGLFTIHHRDKLSLLAEGIELLFKNRLCQSRRAFVPMVGTQIGLAYDTYCNSDMMHLTFRLAFDAQYIWRINQIIETRHTTPTYGRISEDMSIHGVTFDIRFDF